MLVELVVPSQTELCRNIHSIERNRIYQTYKYSAVATASSNRALGSESLSIWGVNEAATEQPQALFNGRIHFLDIRYRKRILNRHQFGKFPG